MRNLRFLLAALVVGAWAAGPLPSAVAQAPPAYQSSDPAKGEMMHEPPSEVTVTFDQPLDQSSWMNVLDECGKEVDAGPATVDLNELTVSIGSRTPSGTYKVVYKAVGLAGATGESGSSFEFMVHGGAPCKGKKHDHDDPKKKKHRHHPGKDRDDHDDHDDDPGPGHDDHAGMTGGGGMDHGGHTMSGGGGMDHGDHPTGHGRHDRNHRRPPATAGGGATPPFASGGGGAPVSADGKAVLVGLGLAVAVGVLGGWLLRMSTPQPAARPKGA